MTAIQPPGRYGALNLDGTVVSSFEEKPAGDGAWINGGFFVLNGKVIDYIEGDDTHWEKEPLECLAKDGQMMGYRFYGFWSCMDTLRDKNELEELWASQKAPWKIWR